LSRTAAPHAARAHPHRRLQHAAVALVMLVVAVLVVRYAARVDWSEVGRTLAALPPATLGAAAAIVVAAHLVYACFDLLGRRYAPHGVAAPRVMGIAFTAYLLNLNLGPLVGSIGARLRLYTRFGVRASQVARIIAFSLVTNWSGYLVLAGIVLATHGVDLPGALGVSMLRVLGVAMAVLPLAYLWACARARRREWHLRGHHFRLPSARLAVAQLAISCLNWALMAAVIWTLLPPQVAYPAVLATLLVAAVAALVTHIPGGLGVLEGVFVMVLGAQAGPAAVLAALLGYRALYYLLPLALAAVMFFVLEGIARGERATARA
jgi:uncharacterized membrane protein YbhN (UPF0104 family)